MHEQRQGTGIEPPWPLTRSGSAPPRGAGRENESGGLAHASAQALFDAVGKPAGCRARAALQVHRQAPGGRCPVRAAKSCGRPMGIDAVVGENVVTCHQFRLRLADPRHSLGPSGPRLALIQRSFISVHPHGGLVLFVVSLPSWGRCPVLTWGATTTSFPRALHQRLCRKLA